MELKKLRYAISSLERRAGDGIEDVDHQIAILHADHVESYNECYNNMVEMVECESSLSPTK